MKIETKRKIILFISRIIKYDEYKNHVIPFFVKRWEINHLRILHSYPNEEFEALSIENLRKGMRDEIIEKLNEDGVITYDKYLDRFHKDYTNVTAEIRFVKAHD